MAIEPNTDVESATGAKQARTKVKRAAKGTRSTAATPGEAIILSSGSVSQVCGADTRRKMIEESAYYLAQRRGFEAGHELEDWFAAEQDVDARLWGEMRPF